MSGRLDRIDLKILRLLQNNGRLTNTELAETTGVSAATMSPPHPAAVRNRAAGGAENKSFRPVVT